MGGGREEGEKREVIGALPLYLNEGNKTSVMCTDQFFPLLGGRGKERRGRHGGQALGVGSSWFGREVPEAVATKQ